MNILLLTTYHPRAQHVGARRWAALSDELASRNHSILHITTNRLLSDSSLSTDFNPLPSANKYQYLTASYSYFFSLKLGLLAFLRNVLAARRSSSPAGANFCFDQHPSIRYSLFRAINKLLKQVFYLIFLNRIPEEKSWANKAFNKHKSSVAIFNPDLIIASYPLWGPALLAEKFGNHLKIPFILDVRDPISRDHQLPIAFKNSYEKIEGVILSKATAILCINASVAKLLVPRNKLQQKLYILPNPIKINSASSEFCSLAHTEYTNSRLSRDSVLRLGYLGTIHTQSLLPEYLATLARVYSNHEKKLCIQYYGRDFQKLKCFFPESLDCSLNNFGYIDLEKEYFSIVNNVDIFIIAGFPGVRGKCVMTGKIFDYIRFGKPIVALCQNGDELSRLLLEYRIGIPFFSVDEILHAFLNVDNLISSLSNSYKPDLNRLKSLCVDQLALELDKLIISFASL